jgi:predicted transcriptional regulator
MPRRAADVTDTELGILEVLWEHGPATVRQVVEALYGEHRPSLHGGVKSLIERLIEKGYVRRDKTGFAHQFGPAIDRDAFVAQQLQDLADSHYGGEVVPMLLTLVERVRLSHKDRETIRKIIENIRE